MSKYYFIKLLFSILISFCLLKSVNSLCNQSNCPILRGICYNDICHCFYEYQTLNNDYINSDNIFCNYKKKSRYIAALLEFFLPVIGHIYSGKTYFAVIKSAFIWIVIIDIIVIFVKGRDTTETTRIILVIVLLLSILSILIMQISDKIGYISGFYLDGNRAEMI